MRTVQLLIVIGLVLLNSVAAEDRTPASSPKTPTPAINSDEPMSIFNEDIRRFSFKMEHEQVSVESAMSVWQAYFKDEKSGVIGIYPDRVTNSLVFIASPEAESTIRKALATRIIELWGIPDYGPQMPLETQKELLERERKDQLARMANLECEFAEFDDEKDREVVDRFHILLDEASQELKVIERRIQIVEKYLKLQDEPPIQQSGKD